MSFFRETAVPYFSGGQWGWLPEQALDLTANNGFESVYAQMIVNGGRPQYFYDEQGIRLRCPMRLAFGVSVLGAPTTPATVFECFSFETARSLRC